MSHPALDAVRSLTGRPGGAVRPLGGDVFAVEVDGGPVVAKRHASAGKALAEVTSLAWLDAAGSVRVPTVLGSDRQWVIMNWVPAGRPGVSAAEEFGRQLAGLHRAGASAFGLPPPGGAEDAWIGHAPMRNEPAGAWPSWYAGHRLLPYLRGAQAAGHLPASAVRLVDQVCDRIDELAGPPEQPSRLHGDLWSGNVLWSVDGVWLIDPAAHGGHRETDLAMLGVFGCPHLERVLAAYAEADPLAEGWRDRRPLHQLFPLLVHAALFGASYADAVSRAASDALRVS